MTVLEETYLPFSEDVLSGHFADVKGGERRKHLAYYLESLGRVDEFKRQAKGDKPTPAQVRVGRQIEKDERFWVVTALLSLYYAEGGPRRQRELFAGLLRRSGIVSPSGSDGWEDALAGELRLFFEVSLPSPSSYQNWLRDHLDDHVLVPHLRTRAKGTIRLEGATKVDAMLLAPETGTAVLFEAKVLSDVSTHVQFDVARNQLARTIDVALEENPKLLDSLDRRLPERSHVVLLTPELFRPRVPSAGAPRVPSAGAERGRLYGWLMPEYRAFARNPSAGLLAQHLPHRDETALRRMSERLGWATWEDCNRVLPRACPWLGEEEMSRR